MLASGSCVSQGGLQGPAGGWASGPVWHKAGGRSWGLVQETRGASVRGPPVASMASPLPDGGFSGLLAGVGEGTFAPLLKEETSGPAAEASETLWVKIALDNT